jgi:RNA polymerase-binding transcription factor DksA
MNDSSTDWLADAERRLRDELDDLYLANGEHLGRVGTRDAELERRIALLLRAFDMIETGEYGHCAVCAGAIEPGRLSQDPATDTCERCGPGSGGAHS